jgi:hypothetical protein
MSSLADLPDLTGFFSYSRRDDELSQGSLSRLRTQIYNDLRLQLGLNFKLWQDTVAIPEGAEWEREIQRAISESVFFIPIVTPSSVASIHCRKEFEAFLDREEELGRENLVFPLLYVRVPALEKEELWRQDTLLGIIGRRQYFDWQKFRHRSFTEGEIAERIGQFCQNIVESLQQPWVSPAERRAAEEAQRSAAQARRDQEEKDRQQSDSEARLKAERGRVAAEAEAQRIEDEERRRAEEEKQRREVQKKGQLQLEGSAKPRTVLQSRRGLTRSRAVWNAIGCVIALFVFASLITPDVSIGLPDIAGCSSFRTQNNSGSKGVTILANNNPVAEAAGQYARGIAEQQGFTVANYLRQPLTEATIRASLWLYRSSSVFIICGAPSPAFLLQFKTNGLVR